MATPHLNEYQRKRDFRRTPEPSVTAPAGAAPAVQPHLYVMHKHAARRLHFDLRIEQDGVLRSWALPKGPPLDSGEKHLAVEVEDHPLAYAEFEGTIPKGEYGGGTVMLWDVGLWQLNGRNDDEQIDFILTGAKLKGAWTLVRMRDWDVHGKNKQWLLIKRTDHPQHTLHPDDLSVASGRSMEEIAANRDPHEAGTSPPQRPAPPIAKELPGARKVPPPATLPPQLATPSESAPSGKTWLHEIKFDGYRILAHIEHGKARLMTRNGHDWTARLRTQAKQLEALPVQQAILDGELVALDAGGASSFRELQESLSRKQSAQLTYQLFDLVYLDGHDLSALPLAERKQALAQLLQAAAFEPGGVVRYSDHVQGQGPEFFEQACMLGLEGIVSKRADAPYRSGRSKLWLKAKCGRQNAEFVVGGYTPPAGARSGFGALLLGTPRDGLLEYSGRLGTGFSARQLEQLHAQLQHDEIDHSPFASSPMLLSSRGVHWVKPTLVVAVEYVERTRDGLLRQPSFVAVREDVEPGEIESIGGATLEEAARASTTQARHAGTGAVDVAGAELTHPERILYPEQGVTKLALARYYESIHEWVLPYLAQRPLVLVRCPEGRPQGDGQKGCFYQKHLPRTQAGSVPRIAIREEDEVRDYAYVRSLADLLALVQHDVLEFHPWGCRVEDIEHPDLLVFDLDPAPEVAWSEVVRTARELRERLQQLGLTAFLRTTGGKGLHLVVPLQPRADWHTAKEFAKAVVERHAHEEPRLLTTSVAMAKRRGKIFLDYLRNTRGSTAIASYSPRARPRAPVAVPLRWDELSPALRSDHYTVETLPRRLGALKADPWEGFFEAAVPLSAGMLKAAGGNHRKL
ncbi:ATP-dependent DNA ligase [Ferrigenium kumadai]|uniref:DNA ligase (ATP) n=1 Tax=Ferrigenium kumadai TaxID=1682490 RepID=A0AAN1VZW3_9PROT|nr:DNA ligase D [Ferrigenium kumadai]BBI98931.1 ATP-dependent DNA ligase [Ferrigenium kumadai]